MAKQHIHLPPFLQNNLSKRAPAKAHLCWTDVCKLPTPVGNDADVVAIIPDVIGTVPTLADVTAVDMADNIECRAGTDDSPVVATVADIADRGRWATDGKSLLPADTAGCFTPVRTLTELEPETQATINDHVHYIALTIQDTLTRLTALFPGLPS